MPVGAPGDKSVAASIAVTAALDRRRPPPGRRSGRRSGSRAWRRTSSSARSAAPVKSGPAAAARRRGPPSRVRPPRRRARRLGGPGRVLLRPRRTREASCRCGPRGALGDQQAGRTARRGAGSGADGSQGVRVALLRHEHRCTAQRGVQGHVAEAGAGEDLQILGQTVDRGRGLARCDHRVGEPVERPTSRPGYAPPRCRTRAARPAANGPSAPGCRRRRRPRGERSAHVVRRSSRSDGGEPPRRSRRGSGRRSTVAPAGGRWCRPTTSPPASGPAG